VNADEIAGVVGLFVLASAGALTLVLTWLADREERREARRGIRRRELGYASWEANGP